MAFCRNCGNQIEGADSFCSACGAAQSMAKQRPLTTYSHDQNPPGNVAYSHSDFSTSRLTHLHTPQSTAASWGVALFTMVVIGASCWLFLAPSNNSFWRTLTPNSESTVNSTPSPPIEVTAFELYDTYENNEVAANMRFKGKRLKVSGVISNIAAVIMDEPVLSFHAGKDVFNPPQATGFSREQVAALSKGQYVTVECTGDGEILGAPMLNNCVVLTARDATLADLLFGGPPPETPQPSEESPTQPPETPPTAPGTPPPADTAAPPPPTPDADIVDSADIAGSVDPTSRNMNPPRYPRDEVRRGITGTTTLIISIDADGEVLDVEIERSSGNRNLDRAAMEAAHKWRFNPEVRNGQNVASRVIVPVQFTLN